MTSTTSTEAANATDSAKHVSSEDLGHVVLEVFAAVQRSSGAEQVIAVIDELDLTVTQFKLLLELEVRERPCSIKEAGGCVGLSLPAASRATDTLVRRGLLERHEDEQDRRIKRLRLSPAGREAAGRIREARLAGIEEIAARLTPAERTRIAEAVRPLIAAARHPGTDTTDEDPAT